MRATTKMAACLMLALSAAGSVLPSVATARGRSSTHAARKPLRHQPMVSVAYGTVIGASIPRADTSPDAASTLHGVSLQTPLTGSPAGTYCLLAHTRFAVGSETVVVSPIDTPEIAAGPFTGAAPVVIPYAAWITAATHCAAGEVQIQTFEYTYSTGGLTVSPSAYVSFTFTAYLSSVRSVPQPGAGTRIALKALAAR